MTDPEVAHIYAIDGVAPVVDPSAYVHPAAVLIGDVIIGPGCYIGPGASLRGDMGRIQVGEGCNIQDNCIVHGFPGGVTAIGDEGHIGHGAVLHSCTVRENALVGMNAVVMDGAEIGASAWVAAMALVVAGAQVPARTLAAGIPARVVRDLTEQELAWKRTATAEYQHLTVRSLASIIRVAPLAAPESGRPQVRPRGAVPLHETKRRD